MYSRPRITNELMSVVSFTNKASLRREIKFLARNIKSGLQGSAMNMYVQ